MNPYPRIIGLNGVARAGKDTVAGILHGEFVQVELFTHFVQLGRRRIGQGHPDKAVRPCDVLADIGDGNICQLGSLFVGHAIDQHGSILGGFVAACPSHGPSVKTP